MPKYQRDISELEGKIIAMYGRGMSARQISDQIQGIYGFEVSEGMVTGIKNKLLPQIEACKNGRWADQWGCISPMYKFSKEMRKVIYTTNAIESRSRGYRRLNRNRSVFPTANPCSRPYTWPSMNGQKNGASPCETGVRCTGNWRSCILAG